MLQAAARRHATVDRRPSKSFCMLATATSPAIDSASCGRHHRRRGPLVALSSCVLLQMDQHWYWSRRSEQRASFRCFRCFVRKQADHHSRMRMPRGPGAICLSTFKCTSYFTQRMTRRRTSVDAIRDTRICGESSLASSLRRASTTTVSCTEGTIEVQCKASARISRLSRA